MNSQNRGLVSSIKDTHKGVFFLVAAIIAIGGFFVASAVPAMAADSQTLQVSQWTGPIELANVYGRPVVVKAEGTYHMWYGTGDTTLYHTSSTDPSNFTAGDTVSFSEGTPTECSSPAIVYEGSTFYMVVYGSSTQKFAIYTSNDGSSWTYAGIVFDGVGMTGYSKIDTPSLVADGTGYKLYFQSKSIEEGNPYRIFAAEAGQSLATIAGTGDSVDFALLATNPVLVPSASGWDSLRVMQPAVVKDGVNYYMWYTGYSATDPISKIGFASSLNGIDWIKSPGNPVITGSVWEASPISNADGSYQMWYMNQNTSKIDYISATGPFEFSSIQDAINTASAGDTINVEAGTYIENLAIDKSLSLMGKGDTTHITGNINATGDSVTIQDLKITNSNSHDSGSSDFGVKGQAGKSLTLEAVTIDVLHNGVYIIGDSTTNDTTIIINHSSIKGYGAVYLSGAINSAGNRSAIVTIHDTNLTGTTSYSGESDDFATLSIDSSNVTVNFTGSSSVANEYTGGAQAKEYLIWFYDAGGNSVTGTPTYTNAENSKVSDGARFLSAGIYTNTVEGQVVARYVRNTAEFEAALASPETTPIVVGRYETDIVTTGDKTLNVDLIISDNTPVTIAANTTLTNNGTITLEPGAIFTNNGKIDGAGTIESTLSVNKASGSGCSDTTGAPYCTIQAAITAAFTGSTINVAAGTYDEENILITKGLTLQGAGAANTFIAPSVVTNNSTIKVQNPSGNVTISGFTFVMQPKPDYGSAVAITGNIIGIDSVTVTISDNAVTGSDDGSKCDYGFYGQGNNAKVVITKNVINKTGDNPIVFEQQAGSTTVYDNDFYITASPDYNPYFSMAYGDLTVSTPQIVEANKFYLDHSGSGYAEAITFDTAVLNSWYGNTTDTGHYTNIQIKNNEIYTGGPSARGIGLIDLSASDGMGTISGAVITGNQIIGDNLTDTETYGITLRGDIEGATIQNNTVSNVDVGLWIRPGLGAAPVCPSGNHISYNQITQVATGVKNECSGTVDVSLNWWGTGTESEFKDKISANVDYDPWYINAAKTVLSDLTYTDASYTSNTAGQADVSGNNIVLDDDHQMNLSGGLSDASGGTITVGGNDLSLSSFTSNNLIGVNLTTAQNVGGVSVTVGSAVKLNSADGADIVLSNSGLSNVSVTIPDNTTILAPAGWDGKITPPKTDTGATGTAPPGFSVGSTKIEVGSSAGILLFDKPVKITLTGVTGTVGYRPTDSTEWKTIDTKCNSATDYSNISFPNECYYPVSGDTVIWTYHFTTFGSLSAIPAATVTSSGGGGGGPLPTSNAYADWLAQSQATLPGIPAITPATETQGQVLGEQTFADGAMIRATNGFDVFIVKYVPSTGSGQAAKKFKRLILNPSVFNSYQHLKWADVLNVDQSVIDSFTTSELVRVVGDTRVYKLAPAGDTGAKQWIRTENAFRNRSFDWDAIYEINATDRNSYATGANLE